MKAFTPSPLGLMNASAGHRYGSSNNSCLRISASLVDSRWSMSTTTSPDASFRQSLRRRVKTPQGVT